MSKANRKFDIVLFGATGFTGALTAEYLALHGGDSLRWALAGRNPQKLEAVRDKLATINPACKELPLLKADVDDAASIKAVAEATNVVITTVGPYLKYGEPLVAACATAGTDYVDLTGEPEFVDRMWLAYHEQAKASGARIVTCCGFDSIPHDLGAWFTVRQLPATTPIRIDGFLRVGGTMSGGTLHSAVNAFSRVKESLQITKQRRAKEQRPANRRIGSTKEKVHFEKKLKAWAVPMPTIDPQIVRRSAAALDSYGPDFRYGHYLLVKNFSGVAKLIGGVSAMFIGAQFKPTRERLLKIKSPGDGPDEAKRAKSWFSMKFIGEGGGKKVLTEVSGGDPGYGETSKMLAESALCLAFDGIKTDGGVVTPAQVMAEPLYKRLTAAGIQFKVLEKP